MTITYAIGERLDKTDRLAILPGTRLEFELAESEPSGRHSGNLFPKADGTIYPSFQADIRSRWMAEALGLEEHNPRVTRRGMNPLASVTIDSPPCQEGHDNPDLTKLTDPDPQRARQRAIHHRDRDTRTCGPHPERRHSSIATLWAKRTRRACCHGTRHFRSSGAGRR